MKRSLVLRAALGFVTLSTTAAEALTIADGVRPPAEACHVDAAGFQAPAELLDCARSYCLIDCTDPNCARLVPRLRAAARTRDAQELLVQSAAESYLALHPEAQPGVTGSPVVAQALADLAVTGRAAYASFRARAPREPDLTPLVRQRLLALLPLHQPVLSDLVGAVRQALYRAHRVAWALRGPTPHRLAHRAELGWIAVEGEEDPPHRPVNVPSAPFPQYDMTVTVDGIPVTTRYMVASRQVADEHPVDIDDLPSDREHPVIVGDVVVFIHGHSSSVEEAVPLAQQLIEQSGARGRPVTIIAMDLPTNGYASMIEHTTVAPWQASLWNSGYPILDFIESFVIAFVDGLDARQPGLKAQIVGVVGGSLGGNMTLRLARRDPASYPWLRNVVSWSPASAWVSWARAVLGPATTGRYYDYVKHEAVRQSRDKMRETEIVGGNDDSMHTLFHEELTPGTWKTGRVGQADHWYSPSWPCRDAAIRGSHRAFYEIYNATLRRWHWRVAHEQLIYSHRDSDNPDLSVDPDPRINPAAGPARYTQIKSRVLLAAGRDDSFFPEQLFLSTKELAAAMTMVEGSALFLDDTGHSIHVERPAFFAGRILDFLFVTPAAPFPAFLMADTDD
jgi:pimeloyl-ACP methyl ester carboxylesterase